MRSKKPFWILIVVLLNSILVIMLEPAISLGAGQQGDGRVIWSVPRLLYIATQEGAFIPVIRGDSDGRLMVVYNQVTERGAENPYYRESIDGGKSWSEAGAVQVNDDELLQATFEFDGQDVAHAIWRTQSEIWHSSEDQWPYSANQITATLGLVFNPDLAIDENGTLHVVWAQEDNRVYYAQSVDAGVSWQGETAVTVGGAKSDQPAVAADEGGNVHVVWEERIFDPEAGAFRYEVRYQLGISETSGINWSGSPTVLSANVLNARQPDVVAQGEYVHVAFARRDANNAQYAYYIIYSPGFGWSKPLDITHDPVTVNSNVPFVLVPTLAPCDDAVYVYYHGALATNTKEIILGSGSSDNWERRDLVDVGSARAIRPSATCMGGKLHMVYEKVIRPNIDHQVYYLSGNRHATVMPMIRR